MLTDYLSAEQLLIDRLQSTLAAPIKVFAAADLAGVVAATQHTPAVHVIYMGDEGGDSAGRGQAQIVQQRWYAVVVTRNARSQITGQVARAAAGPIIVDVLKLLQGWRPSPDHSPLQRIFNVPAPRVIDTCAYFPLGFTTQIAVVGSAQTDYS